MAQYALCPKKHAGVKFFTGRKDLGHQQRSGRSQPPALIALLGHCPTSTHWRQTNERIILA